MTVIHNRTTLLAVLVILLFSSSCNKQDDQADEIVIEEFERDITYVLPYPVGSSYFVTQCNFGSFTHNNKASFAWDFDMFIGTTITASKAGNVIEIKEHIVDGDNSEGNFVKILHSDGTVGRYWHLTKNGALVEIGDFVNRGDTIALSGNTGFSTGPHLHFDVIYPETCDEKKVNTCETVAIGFINSIHPVPYDGRAFKALPY